MACTEPSGSCGTFNRFDRQLVVGEDADLGGDLAIARRAIFSASSS
jgi:hypothetical protein